MKVFLRLVGAALAACLALIVFFFFEYHLKDRGAFLPEVDKEMASRLLDLGAEKEVFDLSQIVGQGWVRACALLEYDDPNRVMPELLEGSGLRWREIDYENHLREGIWPIVVLHGEDRVTLFHIPRRELIHHPGEAFCFEKDDAFFGIRTVPHGQIEVRALVRIDAVERGVEPETPEPSVTE